jgi:uncharacterized repeat protein (TIGR03806 family)
VSSSQIDVSWGAATDDVGVTGYRLERCQAAGCTTFTQIATPSGTGYTDTTASASTSYTYRVHAVDAAGNVGPFSNTGSATTPTAADTQSPTAPSGLSATAASNIVINLSWTAATDNVGVTGYRLERCQAAGCTTFTQIATPSGTSYSDTSLSTSTSYSYRVRAVDAAGNAGPFSNTASATTLAVADTQAPTAPGGLSATAASNIVINLSWTAATDNVGVTGYRLERCQAAGCTSFTQIATPSGMNYSDTSLLASTSYSYRVRAVDAAGNAGPFSNTGSATTQAAAPVVGLDVRPSNTTCVAPSKTPSNTGNTIALQQVFAGVSLDQPLAMLQAPGDNTRWFVLQKTGAARVFPNTTTPTATTFLSLTVNTNSEGGLLGMAFHPNWATNHQAYVSFTEGSPMVSVIARFTSTDGGATLNPSTRQDILKVNQPYDNHDGGNIAFGPDGNLYIGFGDGGSGGDPEGHGQDTRDLLGSFLRINVDGTAPYTIPSDNPFATSGVTCGPDWNVKAGNCKEIYAWGVRNPWRWSFDSSTGELWAGDVGQDAYEEIDKIVRGSNYGWNCREGTHAYNNCTTNPSGFVEPVIDYSHSDGYSITGGYVYRGSALPALAGVYLFADYGSGRIWRLVQNGSTYTKQQLLATGLGISSFGQGNDGELYVVDINGGALYKIVDGSGGGSSGSPVPTLLSDTGCVNTQNPSQLASGVIPYAPIAAFWSDGATKERGLAIPNSTSISVGSDGDFTFPNGSVLVKHFRLNGSLIETRLLMRHPDGDWAGYTYEWNAQQTNATLVTGGKTSTVGGQSWRFPSGDECNRCHTQAAGYVLGAEAAQLNHDFVYTSTGRTANELRTLDNITMFATPLGDPANQPAMPDPTDASKPLDQRARAYLHTNCSQCHRPGGPTPSSMDLRYTTLLASTAACDAPPQAGDLGLGTAARIIALGSPSNSVLVARANRRDASGMPPLASNIVDSAGVTLLQQWITGLATCQ